MNEALSYYRDEPPLAAFPDYCYPLSRRVPETFFIRGADCWAGRLGATAGNINPDGAALFKNCSNGSF